MNHLNEAANLAMTICVGRATGQDIRTRADAQRQERDMEGRAERLTEAAHQNFGTVGQNLGGARCNQAPWWRRIWVSVKVDEEKFGVHASSKDQSKLAH